MGVFRTSPTGLGAIRRGGGKKVKVKAVHEKRMSRGLQPPGSKQGWRITARALPRDFHPDLQPPWQRGGEPRPPGKPSPRSECKDRRRGNWELDLPWRSGDRKQGFAIELPSMPALALASVFPSVKEAQ